MGGTREYSNKHNKFVLFHISISLFPFFLQPFWGARDLLVTLRPVTATSRLLVKRTGIC